MSALGFDHGNRESKLQNNSFMQLVCMQLGFIIAYYSMRRNVT